MPLPLLSDSPEAGRHWLPVRCSLARSLLPHIRHRSLNIQDVPLPAGRRGGAVAVRRLLRELPPVAVRRLLQYIRVRELPEEWSVRRLPRELPEERSSSRSNCSPPSTVRELPGERSQFAGFYASCRRSGRSSPSTVCELPEERSQFAFYRRDLGEGRGCNKNTKTTTNRCPSAPCPLCLSIPCPPAAPQGKAPAPARACALCNYAKAL